MCWLRPVPQPAGPRPRDAWRLGSGVAFGSLHEKAARRGGSGAVGSCLVCRTPSPPPVRRPSENDKAATWRPFFSDGCGGPQSRYVRPWLNQDMSEIEWFVVLALDSFSL